MAISLTWTIIPLAVTIVAILIMVVAEMRQKLACPICGAVFPAPALDRKRLGVGWTIPYLGRVKCPNCGESRSRRVYRKAAV